MFVLLTRIVVSLMSRCGLDKNSNIGHSSIIALYFMEGEWTKMRELF